MSLALASRRAALLQSWLKNELWRRARAVPSLDLRFAENKSLVDATTGANLVTFSRASGGTYVDSQGVIRTATNDAPRFDHNPTTGESLGLLVEEQRTNSIRNNTMVGAVAGTPGTDPTNWITTAVSGAITSKQIVGVGTENGISYIDLQYTTNGVVTFNACVFEQATQIAAATGQTWTSSIYLKLASGSLSNASVVHRVMYRTSAGASVSTNDVSIVPTSATLSAQRTFNTFAASGATIAAVTNQIVVTTTGSSDFTLRIGLPQLEQGAFATSPILTSGATATRSADVASITGSNFSSWYRQDEGTVFASYRLLAGSISSARTIANLNNAPGSDQTTTFISASNTISQNTTVSGVPQGRLDSGPPAANTLLRNAFNYANGVREFSVGGGAVVVGTGSIAAATLLSLGNYVSSTFLNGTIGRLTYWPARLPNTTLQALTQ